MSAWFTPWVLAALAAAPEGQIAYVSGTEQQDQRVCVLDLATGEGRPVGVGASDGAPAWSPDGARIAYHSKADPGLVIRVVNADGSGDMALPHQYGWNHHPQWSTDGCGRAVCKNKICGRYLLYTAEEGSGLDSRIMVYDTQSQTESPWAGGREGMMRPVWLPTLDLTRAKHLEEITWEGVDTPALMQELESVGGVLAVGVAQAETLLSTEVLLATASQAVPLLRLLTEESERYVEWAITPDRDAHRIAFESNDGGNREIFVLHKKGLTNVTNHRAADWNPVWGPSGEWLAFESFREGRQGVYRVFPDTALVLKVDASPDYSAWHPVWSPDSQWVLYVNTASGDPELYVTEVQTGDRRRLTNHVGIDDAPAWRPEV
ncbi:MAG: PD40 domain-containing protein, partial [Candidatus Hydrogenedentes bacterium]|nr:PD40 domain-containing protein [Candidatus Hydrogenedentota bacterium]